LIFCRTTNGSGAPTAAGGSSGGGGSKRLAQQQAQVDEVVDIMRQNVDKVLERDKNLSLLDDRAGKFINQKKKQIYKIIFKINYNIMQLNLNNMQAN